MVQKCRILGEINREEIENTMEIEKKGHKKNLYFSVQVL